MIRTLIGQVMSALVIGGFLVGWWLAADQDFGVMAQQALDLFIWVGNLFRPLIEKFNGTVVAS